MRKSLFLVLVLSLLVSVGLEAQAAELGRIESLMSQLFTTYDMTDISYVVIFQDNKDSRGSSKILMHGCSGKIGEIYNQHLTPGGTITYSVTYQLPTDLKQAVVQAIERTEVPIFAGGLFSYYASILGSDDGIMWIWKNDEKIVCPGDDGNKLPPLPGKGSDKDKEEFLQEIGDVMKKIGAGETFEEEWLEPIPNEEPVPELVPNYQLSPDQALIAQGTNVMLVIIVSTVLFLGSIFLFVRLRRA